MRRDVKCSAQVLYPPIRSSMEDLLSICASLVPGIGAAIESDIGTVSALKELRLTGDTDECIVDYRSEL